MISKLKKIFKAKKTLASLMAVLFGIMLFNPLVANASNLRVTNKYNKLSYLSFANGKEKIFFPMKVIQGTNEPVYCLEHAKLTPRGEVYTGKGYLDNGIRYILAQNPNTGDSNKDYYIKQAAVHYYLRQIPELNDAKNTSVKRAILDLVKEAKAHKNDNIIPGLSMSNKTVDFKYYEKDNAYETDWVNIKTTGDVKEFNTTLEKAPEGVEIVLPGGKVVNKLGSNDRKFYLKIDANKVKDNFTMKMNVNAIFKIVKVQEFVPRDSKYQKIAYPQSVEVKGNDEAELTARLNKVYGKIEVVKKGDNGKLLDNVKFSLYKEDGKTKVADGVTKDGKLLFSNLDQGTYILREDQAPKGYVVNVKDTTVKVVLGKTTTANIENKEIKGRIQITKVDEETGKKLEGAQFEIKDKTTGKVLEKVTTNKEGVALSSYYPYGTQVVIKETKAPAKYTLNGKEYFATITENMKTIEITVANRMIKGSISVHKVDKHTNKPLAGVEFNVLDSNNKVVDKLVTDENGNAKTKILNCGEYKLVETKTNKYYKLNSNPIVVNIAENKDYNYTIQNEAIPGKLLIKKTDITTGKEIEGAKIKITCIEGSDKGKVIEFVSGKTAKEFDLKAGKYTYKEVQAPKGYELNKEVGTFEITEQGQVVKCDVKDKATTGKLLIKKVDIATGKEIEGAKIKITCIEGLDKGKVIEFISGKTAKEFDLKAGKYTYEEVQAPKGYELNKEIGQFEITKEGQIVECSVKDKAIEKPVEKTTPKVELPRTGYEGAIIGGALIVIAGVVLVLRKKSNK